MVLKKHTAVDLTFTVAIFLQCHAQGEKPASCVNVGNLNVMDSENLEARLAIFRGKTTYITLTFDNMQSVSLTGQDTSLQSVLIILN